MKVKEFERLAREHFLPYLPGFELKNDLLFASPIGYLLRVISYQPSTHSATDFYVGSVVQPLYVPKEDVAGRLGERSDVWTLGGDPVEEIRQWVLEEGLPVLEQAKTPAELAAC